MASKSAPLSPSLSLVRDRAVEARARALALEVVDVQDMIRHRPPGRERAAARHHPPGPRGRVLGRWPSLGNGVWGLTVRFVAKFL